MVTIPIARPTQSLAGLAGKSPPCPQSCWIMNRRTSSPAASGAMAEGVVDGAWKGLRASDADAHSRSAAMPLEQVRIRARYAEKCEEAMTDGANVPLAREAGEESLPP